DTLLGVVGDKLIVNNENQVFCINWPNFDPRKRSSRVDNEHWETMELARKDTTGDAIHGRGFVTSDSVIMPTAWQLYQYDLKNGSLKQLYPPGTTSFWSEEEGPGNVLLTPDSLIIAGPTAGGSMRVNVFRDLPLVMAKLDAAVAA